jgi:hypothetical protein
MLRPITVAPRFDRASSTTAELGDASPPCMPCSLRHASSAIAHSCICSPPMPSGSSRLWPGPATNPSSDIEIHSRSFAIGAP